LDGQVEYLISHAYTRFEIQADSNILLNAIRVIPIQRLASNNAHQTSLSATQKVPLRKPKGGKQ
jgi:hypothetical protein